MLGVVRAFGTKSINNLLLSLEQVGIEEEKREVLEDQEILHVYELMIAIQEEEEIDQEVTSLICSFLEDSGFDPSDEISENLIEILSLMTRKSFSEARAVFLRVIYVFLRDLAENIDDEEELEAVLDMIGAEDVMSSIEALYKAEQQARLLFPVE